MDKVLMGKVNHIHQFHDLNFNADIGIQLLNLDKNVNRTLIGVPFRFDHFCLILITVGHLKVNVNASVYCMESDQLMLLSPHLIRKFEGFGEDLEGKVLIFSSEILIRSGIDLKSVGALEMLSPFINPIVTINKNKLQMLAAMLDLLSLKIEDFPKHPYGGKSLQSFFKSIFFDVASLYKIQSQYSEVSGTRREELTFRFLRLLPKNCREIRSLKAYADLLFVTPKHLSRTVKEVTGQTAGVLIGHAVIVEAKTLLNNLELTIGEVAKILNFSSQYFFSKYFKNYCGITPSSYRSSH